MVPFEEYTLQKLLLELKENLEASEEDKIHEASLVYQHCVRTPLI